MTSRCDNISGNSYLEHGRPVRVLVRWSGKKCRNVLIERTDGTRVVRPFRGLRKLPPETPQGPPAERDTTVSIGTDQPNVVPLRRPGLGPYAPVESPCWNRVDTSSPTACKARSFTRNIGLSSSNWRASSRSSSDERSRSRPHATRVRLAPPMGDVEERTTRRQNNQGSVLQGAARGR
jgi:hypothetical protein